MCLQMSVRQTKAAINHQYCPSRSPQLLLFRDESFEETGGGGRLEHSLHWSAR